MYISEIAGNKRSMGMNLHTSWNLSTVLWNLSTVMGFANYALL